MTESYRAYYALSYNRNLTEADRAGLLGLVTESGGGIWLSK